ncbi:MAG: 23S rRNA (uracil(1939)-C(5))-methyltransferase RlmD [Clostridia bacterium]|nr:23S rRNA (uracil(1939)-C(5))-methyltransferase RlmD [Clostridia bacterium]
MNKLSKNDELEVTIESLGINGEGVAHVDGQVIFVPFALPGEVVKIRIINAKSKILIGKAIEIVKKSEFRVNSPCPYFTQCGGCDLQHLSYNKALEFKRNLVAGNLKNIGKVEPKVDDCYGDEPYYYRNKAAFPIVYDGKSTKIGMFRELSHKLVETENCIITQDYCEKLLKITNNYLNKFKIKGYNEENGEGDVRHLVARNVDGHLIVTLVATKKDLAGLNEYYKALKAEFNVSLWLNINKARNNVIFGKEFIFVAGKKEIDANICGLKVSINPASFMQVNDKIRDKIYSEVLTNISKGSIVIDAFSGAGVMTGICSRVAQYCYGLEIVPEAVKDADNLKIRNNLANITNICGDCAETLPKLAKKLGGEKDLILILDPPRKGVDLKVIEAISELKPKKIIYVSCDSSTLSRDVRLILDNNEGYKITRVSPFDMFPQTRHVETLLILEKERN